MKKLFFFASAAALLATSCSDDLGFKNQTPLAEGDTTLIATYELGNAVDASDEELDTRTSLSNVGGTIQYSWSNGDAIGVYGVTGSGASATAAGNAYFAYNGYTNSFSGDLQSLKSSGLYYGYYPYNQQGTFGQAAFTGGTYNAITSYFLETQNYNHTAANGSYSLNPPSGSFSNGVAPAIAVGTSMGNQLYMNFQSVGSYLVVPIVNYGPYDATITSVTLQVTEAPTSTGSTGTTSYQTIAGSLPVNMYSLGNSTATNLVNKNSVGTITAPSTIEGSGKSLYLNCGEGIDLAVDGQTNLWFVIPPTVSMGATNQVIVTLNGSFAAPSWESAEAKTLATTITKTFGAYSNPNNTANGGWGDAIGSNRIILLTPDKGQPYALQTTANTFVIQNVAQFLEYAYLISNGDNAVSLYQKFSGATTGQGDLSYSSLPEMVEFKTTSGGNQVAGKVKNALIAKDLTFSKQALQEYLSGMSSTLLETEYYSNVYGSYLANGSIPSIGGGAFGYITQTDMGTLEITSNNMVTLSNLVIKDSNAGLLQGGACDSEYGKPFDISLSNVELDNLTVNYTNGDGNTFYTMLVTSDKTSVPGKKTIGNALYSNVIVNSNCKLAGNAGSAAANKQGLFLTDYASYYEPYSNGWPNYTQGGLDNYTTGVENNTTYLFANTANLNKAWNLGSSSVTTDNNGIVYGTVYDYSFTETGRQMSSFNSIVLTAPTAQTPAGRQGFGCVVKVNDGVENAVALMNAIYNNGKGNTTTPYSVIDSSTSYWTGKAALNNGEGTAWMALGTSEALAALVQKGKLGYGASAPSSFVMPINGFSLNLMGQYNGAVYNRWWNGGFDNIVLSGYNIDDNNVNNRVRLNISNVYIDGTKPGTNGPEFASAYLSLLGRSSEVNYVNIDGITINVNESVTYGHGVLGIAAISSYNSLPATGTGNGVVGTAHTSSNISVSNMTVNTNGATQVAFDQTTGGLYGRIFGSELVKNGNNAPYLSAVTIEPVLGNTDNNLAGYLAGELNVTFGKTADAYYKTITINNPYSSAPSNRYAFGKINVDINPVTSDSFGSCTLVLNGFTNIEEFIGNKGTLINFTANNNVQDGFSFYIIANGNQYLWQCVDGRQKTFQYKGQVVMTN